MTFRIDDSETIVAPKHLGNMAVTGDPFPGVADDAGFVGFNPDQPAVQVDTDNVVSLLKDIRNLLRNPPKENPFWFHHIKELPNVNNSRLTIQSTERFKYIWVPRAPRALNVYADGIFWGSLTAGDSLKIALPFPASQIELEWATAGGTHYQSVVLSSAKFDIDKV